MRVSGRQLHPQKGAETFKTESMIEIANFSERQVTARGEIPPAKDGKADAGVGRVPRPEKRGT
jgi:hypothetical protein